MAYLDRLAKLPSCNITYLKYKDKYYYVIYNYDYKRNSKGIPQSKKLTIGKIANPKDEYFHPNENYVKVYGDKVEFVNAKPAFNEPKADIEKEYDLRNQPIKSIEYTQPVGLHLAVEHLAMTANLYKILRKVFNNSAPLIFSLATYILSKGNAISGYEKWAQKHYLAPELIIDKRRILDFFVWDIKEEKIHEFLELWQKSTHDEEFVAYNATSRLTLSQMIGTERSYNEENDFTKQINVGVVYGYNSKLTLHYSWN
ncbi:hypothetical protein [Psittacicella hinzii]|uniref:Transposase n=1 Tax=Psittacicella hinzii TaxID=2028575 RepID=A0A3A1YT18_9GAMM|nr:hypothetical protein [Psittacicella hinzii]RIY40631.1 hypothetical protein CKF58_00200 [Psittacicella hinzii]